MSERMTPERLARIRDRWREWYETEDDTLPGQDADWPDRDDGESMSHYIVRNDHPDLLAELDAVTKERDEAQAMPGRGRVLTPADFSDAIRDAEAALARVTDDSMAEKMYRAWMDAATVRTLSDAEFQAMHSRVEHERMRAVLAVIRAAAEGQR